jgi:tetratricopeptide (TPR) repeat protein
MSVMPEVTFEEAQRQIGRLTDAAREAENAARFDDAVARWRAVLAHPCAHHLVVDYEVLEEIHQVLRRAGRWDEAIAAKREAIASGYRSEPDPEADIAECLLLAGRRVEADGLFAALRERDPDDVWLYNAAAFAYADVDARASLAWSREGIEVAFRTGDPDGVVMQLLECAEAARDGLGDPKDEELVARVEVFCETWSPGERRRRWDDLEPLEERVCAYCGYDPKRTWADEDELTRPRRRRALEVSEPERLARLDAVFGGQEPSRPLRRELALSVGWFPAGEWAQAIDRWPDLLDELPADSVGYSHAIEARIKRLNDADPGHPMHISPLTIALVERRADEDGLDPGSPEARAAAAAEVLRLGGAKRWPPGRNERCWCGSGRKYKQCCGPVPATEHAK